MALADFVIVEVVRRRDLDAAAAESRIDVGVGDHGDLPIGERQLQPPPDQVPVTLVLGMHRHGGIAQHRFGTGRGDHDEAFAIGERIAQVPQMAVLLRGGHLEVRQRRLQHRVPVHQALAAIDEAFIV